EVAQQVGVVHYRSDESLCEAGAPAGPMFVLIEGTARVELPGSNDPTAIVSAGDFVGEIAAMYGGPRSASVIAQGAVEALAFAPSLLRALARECTPFRTAIEETARERVAISLPRTAPLLQRLKPAAR